MLKILIADAAAELRVEALRAGACACVLKENLHELPGILTSGLTHSAGGDVRRDTPPPSAKPK